MKNAHANLVSKSREANNCTPLCNLYIRNPDFEWERDLNTSELISSSSSKGVGEQYLLRVKPQYTFLCHS